MYNQQIIAELAKVGLSAKDLQVDTSALTWSQLHEVRKKLRRAASNVKGETDAAGAAAIDAIAETVSDLSDEIDTREASGDRDSGLDDRAIQTKRRQDEIAAAQLRFQQARPASRGSQRIATGLGPMNIGRRSNEPLVLQRGDSAAEAYGQSQEDFGDVVRAAITGDFSNLTPQTSQMMGSGGSGGFVVPDQLWGGILDLARSKMRIAEAGAIIIDAPLGGTLSFPTLERDPTAHWRGELQDIEESSAALGLRTFKPYTVAVLVSGSIELMEDAPTLGMFLMSTIAAQIAEQIDFAALAGNGVGQPLGILNHTGIQQVDAGGVLADYDPFARAVQKVRQMNVEPGVFILSPATLGHVDRLADTTGQPLQPPPSMRDRPMLDTNQIVATDGSPQMASAVTGEWQSLYAVFRQRLVLEVSRTSGDSFKKLGWQARGYARVDSFAVRPNRFAKVVNLPAS